MKKPIVVIITGLICVFCFVGCGEKTINNTSNVKETATIEPIKVIDMHISDSSFTDIPQYRFYVTVKNETHDEMYDVSVNIDVLDDNGNILDTVKPSSWLKSFETSELEGDYKEMSLDDVSIFKITGWSIADDSSEFYGTGTFSTPTSFNAEDVMGENSVESFKISN